MSERNKIIRLNEDDVNEILMREMVRRELKGTIIGVQVELRDGTRCNGLPIVKVLLYDATATVDDEPPPF